LVKAAIEEEATVIAVAVSIPSDDVILVNPLSKGIRGAGKINRREVKCCEQRDAGGSADGDAN